MNFIEKSALKFKREIKKARLMKQRDVAHQMARFTEFFESKISLAKIVHLIPYEDGEAFKLFLSNGTRSPISLSSINQEIEEFRFTDLQELRDSEICPENETVILFSQYDYSFPSVLIGIDALIDHFESILDLMENEVVVILSDMKSALYLNNEESVIKVRVFGGSLPFDRI